MNKNNKIEEYWKLSPIERIDYDIKIKNITKNTSFVSLTFGLLELIFFTMLFLYLLNYFFSSTIGSDLITSEQLLISSLIGLIIFFFIADIIQVIIKLILRNKATKELNKRFKL